MMGALRHFLPFLTALALGACASPPPEVDGVPVAPGVVLSLPAPAELGRAVEAAQLVTATRGDSVFTFEGRLSVTARALTLVGTDTMGRRALMLRWDGTRLEVERADWLPQDLHAENILADIVLMYWPETSLRRHISGARIETSATGRRLSRDNAIMVEMGFDGDPFSGLARLANPSWGYGIEVRSVVIGP